MSHSDADSLQHDDRSAAGITQSFDLQTITLADPSGAGIGACFAGATTSGTKSVDLGALRWTQASYVLSPQLLARFTYTYYNRSHATGVCNRVRS